MDQGVVSPFAEHITDLGFPKLESVVSLRSIAHLFGSSKSRCGIYLLAFPEDRIYVGQAIDGVRRFANHRRNYANMVGFSFLPATRLRLDEVEKELIHRAEHVGLTLLNTIHMSQVTGETDLDFVVSPEEQSAWLDAPVVFNQREYVEPLVLPESQAQRFSGQFRKLRQHPMAPVAFQLLHHYVWGCIPSCRLWGFVNVAADVLLDIFDNEAGFMKAFPSVELDKTRDYRDAGQHQISIRAPDESSLRALIENAAVRKATGVLALRVMRKRATIYGKFYCKQLADCLLSPADSEVASSEYTV